MPNGQIVAQSIDEKHHFILPFDLDFADTQETIFNNVLKESISNGMNSPGSFVIELDRFKSGIMKIGEVADEHVALAIFEYLNKNGHYSFVDGGKIAILEDVGDDLLDRPLTMQKWIYFYEHLITTTEHAANICREIHDRFTDKLENLPDAIAAMDKKILHHKSEYEKIDNKVKSGANVTQAELDKQKFELDNFLRCDKQKDKFIAGLTDDPLRKLKEYLDNILQFLGDKDIYIAAYSYTKSIFELGKEANESDMQYAIDLTKAVVELAPLDYINVDLTEKDRSEENVQEKLKKYSDTTSEYSEKIGVFRDYNEKVTISN